MKGNDRTVAMDMVQNRYIVSTIFLGIDHGFDGVPKWYETMVFKCDAAGNVTDWIELACDRYTTREEAIEGHANMVTEWITKNPLEVQEND